MLFSAAFLVGPGFSDALRAKRDHHDSPFGGSFGVACFDHDIGHCCKRGNLSGVPLQCRTNVTRDPAGLEHQHIVWCVTKCLPQEQERYLDGLTSELGPET